MSLPLPTSASPVGLKQQLGCWLNEGWRTQLLVQYPQLASMAGFSWLDLKNRGEYLQRDLITGARICQWQDSSRLTVARTFPALASRLLQHTLKHWPVSLNFEASTVTSSKPDASILIAAAGEARAPLLDLVIASLRGQQGSTFEIIVSEPSADPRLQSRLPSDVRYVHVPQPEGQPFNKSLALNSAARVARGRVLFIHDGDFVVPTQYLTETLRLLGTGDGVRPARMLFYLDEPSTQGVLQSRQLNLELQLQQISQNTPNPMAVTAAAYWRIGGHDESYAGWGGEDTEFLSRLRTGPVQEGGTLPAIHLWHPAAAEKSSGDRNQKLHQQKEKLSPQDRIDHLVSHQRKQAPSNTIFL